MIMNNYDKVHRFKILQYLLEKKKIIAKKILIE